MPRIYDAVVVGAGPAGSTVARELARRGLSVLLLEAKKLPRDKPCGGGLTPRAWRQLDFPIDDLVLARSASVRLQVGRGLSTVVRARNAEIWMVRRRDFDLRLVEEAVRRGAGLCDGEAVVAIERGDPVLVTTESGKHYARVLVGADGAESRVARWLGLARPTRWMVGIEAEVAAEGPSDEAVVDLSIPYGYAWAFPKRDAWSVGVCTFSRAHARELRGLLERFSTDLGPLVSGPPAPTGHRVPTGLAPGPAHLGNALLVGDAAGVADPFFAEGISYAILSGRLAAEATLEYLSGQRSDLASYTTRLKGRLAADAGRWKITAAVVHRFPGICVRILTASGGLRLLVERTVAGEIGSAKLSAVL